MNSIHARIAMVAAPVVIALGLFVTAGMQRGHFVHDSDERQKVEGQISTLLRSMEDQASQPAGRLAAVDPKPTEESQYLSFVRRSAQETGVKIIRWNANAPALNGPTPSPAADPANPNAPANPALNDVVPYSGTLEISGSYQSVLSFARALENADRLINLSAVSWNRSDQDQAVHLSATVTRYVLKAPTPPAPAPAS